LCLQQQPSALPVSASVMRVTITHFFLRSRVAISRSARPLPIRISAGANGPSVAAIRSAARAKPRPATRNAFRDSIETGVARSRAAASFCRTDGYPMCADPARSGYATNGVTRPGSLLRTLPIRGPTG